MLFSLFYKYLKIFETIMLLEKEDFNFAEIFGILFNLKSKLTQKIIDEFTASNIFLKRLPISEQTYVKNQLIM